MDPKTPEQLLDVEACRSLILEFAACVDERRYADLRHLMTGDASFARPTVPDVIIEGADAIVAAFGTRPAHVETQHLNLNLRIRLTGPDTAEGESIVMLFIGDANDAFVPGKGRPVGPPLLGIWRDQFVRTPQGWRFSARRGAVTCHQR